MKQNDEKKDAKVMTQEELENVTGGGFRNVMAGLKKKPYPPKEK